MCHYDVCILVRIPTQLNGEPPREGRTQGREARKAALATVQVIAVRHLDGSGVGVSVHGVTETVMAFRMQSSPDGVTDQNGVWGGNNLGDSQLSSLGDKWGVVLPTKKEGRREAAGGHGREVALCLRRVCLRCSATSRELWEAAVLCQSAEHGMLI